MVCPLYRGCPLLRGSNHIILIGRDKFGDLVLSFVERYLIQCPFLGGSSLRGSTVDQMSNVDVGFVQHILADLANEMIHIMALYDMQHHRNRHNHKVHLFSL